MDGVDIAFLETDGIAEVRFGPTGFLPYEPEDRALLRMALADADRVTERSTRPGALAAAETLVTERHRQAVEEFLAAQGIDRASIDVIGFHGQTVVHRPQQRLTVQIGDGAALARALNVNVAFDFRAADVASGGQGAPLVPIFHKALAAWSNLSDPLIIVNVGGVANLTFVDGTADPIAFDTGPGNALIDDLMLARTGVAMDHNGETAARGTVDGIVLARFLAHPYLARGVPKSLDRNAFSDRAGAPSGLESLSLEDAAATLTAFSATAIAQALAHLPRQPQLAVLCGGGAHNLALRQHLTAQLPCRLTTADALGWSGDGIEAQAFAYLAVRHLKDLPITFPTTTGVDVPLPGGVLARPI